MSALNKEQQQALGRMMLEGFRKGDAGIIRGCLARGADPNVAVQDGGTGQARPALHWAAYHYSEGCMKALLESGADIEARDPALGETALYFAVESGKAEAVELLMQSGADPVAQAKNGTVVMDVALWLRQDYDYDRQLRDKIIKALAKDYGEKPAPQEQSESAPQEAFNENAKPRGIAAPKTASFGQKPGGKGFSL